MHSRCGLLLLECGVVCVYVYVMKRWIYRNRLHLHNVAVFPIKLDKLFLHYLIYEAGKQNHLHKITDLLQFPGNWLPKYQQ